MDKPEYSVESLDELSDAFAQSWRKGENPSVEEYANRYPLWADEIRDLFPMVQLMEQMKPVQKLAADPPSPSMDAEAVPKQLGEYRILREIGRGGMGVVYEAIQEPLGRRVAIKLLPTHLTRDDKILNRFRRESQAAARLHHTNIVPVFGVGEQNGTCYYIMQMIEGVSIDQLLLPSRQQSRSNLNSREAATVAGADAEIPPTSLPRCKPPGDATPPSLSHRMVARIGFQVADALSFAHFQGVLHRDIKPSNLILDHYGIAWVTDFGVAKLTEEANLTQSGELVGTLRYLPPERFQGQSDARGDIYSLGITLYEMLLKRPAFRDTVPHRLIQQITQTELPSLRSLDKTIPVDLERIIAKATSRDPAHRYAFASDFADDLRCYLEDLPIRARRVGTAEQIYRWCRRNKTLASLAASAAVLLLLTTIVSSIAYLRVSSAIVAEKKQRERAEKTSAAALEAFNQIYERLAPSRLIVAPGVVTQGPEGETIELPTQPILAPEAVTLLQQLLGFYQQLALDGSDFPSLQFLAAEANQRIGDIRQHLGQFDSAIDAYRKAIQLYSQIQSGSADKDQPIKLARAYNDLGRCLRVMQLSAKARDAHASALSTLISNVSDQASRPEFHYESARTYYFLSLRREIGPLVGLPPRDRPPPGRPDGDPRSPGPFDFNDRRPPRRDGPPPNPPGEPDSARRAITLLLPLVQEHPNVPEYRHLLACCYRDAYPGRPPEDHRPGTRDEAANLKEALRLLRQLVKDYPQVSEYQYDLCETLTRLANPRRSGPSGLFSEDNLTLLKESLSLTNRLLAEFPGVLRSIASSALVNDRLGLLYLEQKKYDEAENHLRRSVTLQSTLIKQHPEVANFQGSLALTQSALAKTLFLKNNKAEAKQLLVAAINQLETVQLRDTNPEMARAMLHRLYSDLAQIHLSQGEPHLAENVQRKAQNIGPPKGGKPFPNPLH